MDHNRRRLTRKQRPILSVNKRKAERRHRWPQLARIDQARRHSPLDVCPGFGEVVTRQQGLHTEEVAVEEGREGDLVYQDFGS